MSDEKTNDVVASLKRLYPRALVLTSAVVFGGIAIAQAQKHAANTPPSETPLSATDLTLPGLTPVPNRDAQSDHQPATDDSDIALTGAESPQRTESTAAFAEADEPWATSPPVDGPPEDLESDSHDELADETNELDVEAEEAAPTLPDPVAFPAQVDSSPIARRGNPYRDAGTESTSVYSDDRLEDDESVAAEGPEDDIALPDIDSTALPSSRYSDAPPRQSKAELVPQASELPEPIGASPQSGGDEFESAQPTPAARGQQDGLRNAIPATSATDQADSFSAEQPSSPSASFEGTAPAGDSGPNAAPPLTRPSAYNDPIDNAPLDGGPAADGARLEAIPSSQYGDDSDQSFGPPTQSNIGEMDGDTSGGGRPGPQSMEGPQSPSLTLQKRAPQEIQVGRPAKFEILVRNTGRVTAENVVIRDEVPVGTNFVDAAPQATRAQDGAVYWEAGSLAPGQEITVSLEVMPTTEGQIGSVATVSFAASASAKTRATKPELLLEHSGPLKALVGEAVQFSIKLTNPGTGAATQVVLEEDVPEGLAHSSGARLEYEVGAIEPGQTRHLELTLRADKAGHVVNTLVARADGGLVAEHAVELDVVAPDLQVAIEGPNRRYLERQATFTIAVANPGTAPAHNVELVAQLPTGLKFVSTNNSGFYDQSRHAVIWSLEQLPAGEMGKAQFTAMPVEMGSFQIQAEGQADTGLHARQDHDLSVEGIAALFFGVADRVDPIEIGGETTYEIKVVNQGSKAATNVQFAAQVPDGMQAVGAQGPTQEAVEGQRVMFAPIPSLAPREQAIFHIRVAGQSAGDHRFRVQMTSDETSTPVIKEESTRVYSD